MPETGKQVDRQGQELVSLRSAYVTRYDAAELMLYRIREDELNGQPVQAGLRQLMMH